MLQVVAFDVDGIDVFLADAVLGLRLFTQEAFHLQLGAHPVFTHHGKLAEQKQQGNQDIHQIYEKRHPICFVRHQIGEDKIKIQIDDQ